MFWNRTQEADTIRSGEGGGSMLQAGKLLLIVGAVCLLAGLILIYGGRIIPLGKLPGDIYIKKGAFSFYFPLATSVVLSAAVTLILWLISKK